MSRVILDGTPIKPAYEPPPRAPQQREAPLNTAFVQALSNAIAVSFREAIASLPAPVVNVPKPEVKINSPVYVTTPEIKVPATTVNVPDGKAPVVNVEPPAVTLQTNRPTKWTFTVHRDSYDRITTIDAEAK